MEATFWTRLAFPGDAAKAVQAADGFKTAFGRLAVHPYNESNPDNSFWWLFPTSRGRQNWPAYHCGKFVFFRPGGQGAIRAGLHVEKGVGTGLASAYGTAKGRHFEMTKRWLWHSFLSDLRDGTFARALDQIRERSGEGPELTVSVSVPLDEHALSERSTEYRFRSAFTDRLVFLSHRAHEREVPGLEGVQTLPELAERLAPMTSGEGAMLWVDFVVGLDIPIRKEGPGEAWGGSAIWDKVLQPLAPWVREAR